MWHNIFVFGTCASGRYNLHGCVFTIQRFRAGLRVSFDLDSNDHLDYETFLLQGNGAKLKAGEIEILFPYNILIVVQEYNENFKKFTLGRDTATITDFWEEITYHFSLA